MEALIFVRSEPVIVVAAAVATDVQLILEFMCRYSGASYFIFRFLNFYVFPLVLSVVGLHIRLIQF